MTKIEAIKKFWIVENKLIAATYHNGEKIIQPRGLKGAVTKAIKRALKLCDNDKEFITLSKIVREEMEKEGARR